MAHKSHKNDRDRLFTPSRQIRRPNRYADRVQARRFKAFLRSEVQPEVQESGREARRSLPRAHVRPSVRPLVSPYASHLGVRGLFGATVVTQAFTNKSPCQERQERREVLHAIGVAGRSGLHGPTYSQNSARRCV